MYALKIYTSFEQGKFPCFFVFLLRYFFIKRFTIKKINAIMLLVWLFIRYL